MGSALRVYGHERLLEHERRAVLEFLVGGVVASALKSLLLVLEPVGRVRAADYVKLPARLAKIALALLELVVSNAELVFRRLDFAGRALLPGWSCLQGPARFDEG